MDRPETTVGLFDVEGEFFLKNSKDFFIIKRKKKAATLESMAALRYLVRCRN
jgi:hypothetical protein